MNRVLLFACFTLLGIGLQAQPNKNVWSTLALMKYERQYAESDGIGGNAGQAGRFRPIIEEMDGDEIELRGYIIPLNGKKAQSLFMFSAYPYDMCFFCGKAGPESVMEVTMLPGKQVEYSDDSIILKGTFRFMPNDPNGIMYKLDNAEFVGKG